MNSGLTFPSWGGGTWLRVPNTFFRKMNSFLTFHSRGSENFSNFFPKTELLLNFFLPWLRVPNTFFRKMNSFLTFHSRGSEKIFQLFPKNELRLNFSFPAGGGGVPGFVVPPFLLLMHSREIHAKSLTFLKNRFQKIQQQIYRPTCTFKSWKCHYFSKLMSSKTYCSQYEYPLL